MNRALLADAFRDIDGVVVGVPVPEARSFGGRAYHRAVTLGIDGEPVRVGALRLIERYRQCLALHPVRPEHLGCGRLVNREDDSGTVYSVGLSIDGYPARVLTSPTVMPPGGGWYTTLDSYEVCDAPPQGKAK